MTKKFIFKNYVKYIGVWIANELLASTGICVGVAIVMGKIRKILPRILFFFSALSEINDQRKYSESSSYLDCECKCCFQRRINESFDFLAEKCGISKIGFFLKYKKHCQIIYMQIINNPYN